MIAGRLRSVGVVVCVAFAVLMTVAVQAKVTSESIVRQRSKIEAIHARLQQKRQQLDFEVTREADVRHQLDQTNASIAVVQTRLSALDAQVQSELDEEARDRRLLAQAQDALRRQREAYARRLVQMYEQPPATVWAVLVDATTPVDFVERWDDLRYVAAADQREIVARNDAVQRVDALELAVAAAVANLESERDRQAQVRSQLGALAQERTTLLGIVDQQRASVAGEVQNLVDLSAQEEAQLEELLREQEAELQQERAAGRVAIPPPLHPGEMQWPLTGPITSPFGMRLNPFGGGNTEFHPGIDIAVDVGTPVEAAAPGRVIIAGWVSGYGNYVAIDHGDGISTGYGHLSQIYVSVGQDVTRGQAIGASGNTGRSTGPHLIFEVRRNGTPVDPNPYLP